MRRPCAAETGTGVKEGELTKYSAWTLLLHEKRPPTWMIENEEYEATNTTDFQRKVSVRKTINLNLEISCYTSIALTVVIGSSSGHSSKLTNL
jgi:hypothetical protein